MIDHTSHSSGAAPAPGPAHSPARAARHRFLVRAALVLLGATLLPAGARAQAPQPGDLDRARELFVRATEQRDAGDTRGALEKFKAAHDLAANPVTTLELGRTYAMLGMLLEALAAFQSSARIPIQPDESPRATQARQDAAMLVSDTQQQIDRIVASAPVVAPARPQIVDTSPASPTPRLAPAVRVSPPRPESTGIGPMAYVGFGVGVAGLVAGSALGVMAISKATDAQNACSGATSAACKQTAADDLQTARSLGYLSITACATAGLGIAVGIVDLLTDPPRTKEAHLSSTRVAPWIGPGAAGLRGSF
jgi:tetratricopeptide (TPR) repeat protein